MTKELFLIVRTDAQNSAKNRTTNMEAHVKYSVANKHRFCVGGAIRQTADAMAAGSAMIIHADNLEDERTFAAQDPFDQAGVYARTAVWHFNVGIGEWVPDAMKKL